MMDEKGLKTVIAAGALKKVYIVAKGGKFHVTAVTPGGDFTIGTATKFIRTWSTVDGPVRWLHGLGIGKAELDFSKWQPKQRGLGV